MTGPLIVTAVDGGQDSSTGTLCRVCVTRKLLHQRSASARAFAPMMASVDRSVESGDECGATLEMGPKSAKFSQIIQFV